MHESLLCISITIVRSGDGSVGPRKARSLNTKLEDHVMEFNDGALAFRSLNVPRQCFPLGICLLESK